MIFDAAGFCTQLFMHHKLVPGKFGLSFIFICRFVVVYEIIVHFVTTWSIFIKVHRLFCTYDRDAHLLVFL